jgi:hypothetical protein
VTGTGGSPDPRVAPDSVDVLELELRRLPGVRAAGFVPDEDVLVVHLDVVEGAEAEPGEAVRIAARHSTAPVAVEIARHATTLAPTPPAAADSPAGSVTAAGHAAAGETPAVAPTVPDAPRVRLLSVLSFPDTDEVEVHLVHGDHRTIGRARASGGVGAVATATVAALAELGSPLDVQIRWARTIESEGETGALVGVSLVVDDRDIGRLLCYGLAGSHGPMDAAARATLDALNRQLARVLR